MMNDSVREELKDKIISAPRPLRQEVQPKPPVIESDFTNRPTTFTPPPMMPQPAVPFTPPPVMPQPAVAFVPPPVMPQPAVPMSAASQVQTTAAAAVATAVAAAPAAPVVGPMQSRGYTTEIMTKPTSPTLVEFQSKNSALPEWRIQLQNAVRQRSDRGVGVATASVSAVATAPEARPMMSLQTNGAAALKSEPAPSESSNGNPMLSKALQRIEESRRRFAAGESAPQPVAANTAAAAVPTAQPAKAFPFYIATKNAELMPRTAEQQRRAVAPPPATSIVEELPVIEKKPFDTNKLKPLPNAAIIASSLDKVSSGEVPQLEEKQKHFARMTAVEDDEDFLEIGDPDLDEGYETEEDDEIAPLAMRFNSGIFDLLIGAFATLVLLSPLMIYGGTWFSVTGMLAFVVTCAIVMFVYLTTAIGMFGKTVGMKIFALETIDIEEQDYPTFHQAAVSSCVYIASLALGGVGFLPALFNEEKRTAPDLLSGTMVVREN